MNLIKKCPWLLVLSFATLAPFQLAAQQENDSYFFAQQIFNAGFGFQDFTITGTSVDATEQAAEANNTVGDANDIDGQPGGASLWFYWNPTNDINGETITIDTIGSSFDTVLGVYTVTPDPNVLSSTNIGSLSSVAENDNLGGSATFAQSEISFVVDSTETYIILLDGATPTGGAVSTGSYSINFNVEAISGPINDDFEDRINLFGSQITTLFAPLAQGGLGFNANDNTSSTGVPSAPLDDPNSNGLRLASFQPFEPTFNDANIPTDDYVYENPITGDVIPANSQAIDPTQGLGSVWFSWTAPFDGEVNIAVSAGNIFANVPPSVFDPALFTDTAGYYSVYEGTTLLNLTGQSTTRLAAGLAALPSSGFRINSEFTAQVGVTYHIQVVFIRPDAAEIGAGFTEFTPNAPDDDLDGFIGGDPSAGPYDITSDDRLPGRYVLSISMDNDPPAIVLSNPRHNDRIPDQDITLRAFFNEVDDDGDRSEPILNDPSILPYVDRVKFFFQYNGDPTTTPPIPADPGPTLIGTDTEAPYSFVWNPDATGRYELYAVAEDDEFGFNPLTGDVIVTSTQGSNSLAPVDIIILPPIVNSQGQTIPDNPLTNTSTLVNEIYNDVTGSDPTSEQLNSGVDQIDAGTLLPADLAESLYNNQLTPDTRLAQERVIRIFRGLFGRSPTIDEFDLYVSGLVDGTFTVSSLGSTLSATLEYITLYSNLEDAAFINQIFLNTLGRSAQQIEINQWVGAINAGTFTRLSAALLLIDAEAFGEQPYYDLGDFEEKLAVFLTLYNRVPTVFPGEIDAFSSVSDVFTSYFASADFAFRYISNPSGATVEMVGDNIVIIDNDLGVIYIIPPSGSVSIEPTTVETYSEWAADEVNDFPARVTAAGFLDPLGDADGDANAASDPLEDADLFNIYEYALENLTTGDSLSSGADDDATLLQAGTPVNGFYHLDYAVDLAKVSARVDVQYREALTDPWITLDPASLPNGFTITNTGTSGNTILFKRLSVDISVCPMCFFQVFVTPL